MRRGPRDALVGVPQEPRSLARAESESPGLRHGAFTLDVLLFWTHLV
jgi:hypothetical protein